MCDTNNKAAKLIAGNIFFGKACDNHRRSWKELMQHLPGGSQVTYVDKDDEVGRMCGVFRGQIFTENLPITFAREPNQIEILSIDFDPRRRNFPKYLE